MSIVSRQFDSLYRSVDDVGNLYETKEKKDRVYGAGSRLLETKDARFSYDEEGNLVEKVEHNGDTWKYEFYGNGMMAKVMKPDKTEIKFKYDALGRRIEKCSEGKATHFVWDGNTILHEYSTQNGADTLENLKSSQADTAIADNLVTWVFNDGFVPSAKITSEGHYSIISDYLGTPVEAYDEQGNKVWSAELDVYGRVKEFTGEKDFIPFRYQGQYEDVAIGLYYNRFRYYDPEQGNYTQVDPIGLAGGNPTLYGYVGDSNTWTDPFGLLNEFEIAEYASKLHVKDGFTAHEILQNAWLKYNAGVTRRGTGPLSRQNPAIALKESPLHQSITNLQKKYGMHSEETLRKQSALQNINRNAALTRRGIMNELITRGWDSKEAKVFATEKVMELRKQAIEHGERHGLICRK
ncbi:RHS repeat domain-containing protein [Lysinibacillus sp. FSL M8-0355]|uniref:RHS repeat domain-containing protein n=1 Tax=Lysinibacillus sp. FSL M8-0355 TaxID=2921719 RepID=UPI0030F5FDCF